MSEPTSNPPDLAAIRARHDAGPHLICVYCDGSSERCRECRGEGREHEYTSLCRAHDDRAALLAHVERLESERDALRAALASEREDTAAARALFTKVGAHMNGRSHREWCSCGQIYCASGAIELRERVIDAATACGTTAKGHTDDGR